MRTINDEALVFEIKLCLSTQFTSKVFGWVRRRSAQCFGHFGHVDDNRFDAVTFALYLGHKPRHFVSIEDIADVAVDVDTAHVGSEKDLGMLLSILVSLSKIFAGLCVVIVIVSIPIPVTFLWKVGVSDVYLSMKILLSYNRWAHVAAKSYTSLARALNSQLCFWLIISLKIKINNSYPFLMKLFYKIKSNILWKIKKYMFKSKFINISTMTQNDTLKILMIIGDYHYFFIKYPILS